MKRFVSAIIFVIATTMLSAGALAQNKIYTLKIGDFSELTVADDISIRYKSVPDSAGIAVFACRPEMASAITFTNDRNKLKIQVIADKAIDQLPTVTIYSTSLQKATNWGDSTITIVNPTPAAQFKAKVIGNGNIIARDLRMTQVEAAVEAGHGHIFLSGRAQSAKYTIVSAGAIEAGSLEAMRVKCQSYGPGSIDCYPTEELSVTGLFAGEIYYRGAPKIKSRAPGVKVISIDGNEAKGAQ